MHPTRHTATDPVFPLLFKLIADSFASMDARIDPPSSIHRMTSADLANNCQTGEVWSVGTPPIACAVFTPKADCLYIGKLAVAQNSRGIGMARLLIDTAIRRAKERGLRWLELETRIELTENHIAFAKLGFVKTAETSHAGYTNPTGIIMRKPV